MGCRSLFGWRASDGHSVEAPCKLAPWPVRGGNNQEQPLEDTANGSVADVGAKAVNYDGSLAAKLPPAVPSNPAAVTSEPASSAASKTLVPVAAPAARGSSSGGNTPDKPETNGDAGMNAVAKEEINTKSWASDLAAFSRSLVAVAKTGKTPSAFELTKGLRETITLTGRDGAPLYVIDSNLIPGSVTSALDKEFSKQTVRWRLKANNSYMKGDIVIAILAAIPDADGKPANLELGDVTCYIDSNPPADVREDDEFEVTGTFTRRAKSYIAGVVGADGGVPPVFAYYGVGKEAGKIQLHAELTVSSWKLTSRGAEPKK